METLYIYEKLPIPKEKRFIGIKTGTIVNNGSTPGYFIEQGTGVIYEMYHYELM